MPARPGRRTGSPLLRRLRFVGSWLIAVVLVVFGLPKAVGITWHGLVPALGSLTWTGVLALVALWFLGLVVHTFVLTAAAPSLTHRRALTLNLTGSAVSNVVPLGGAAGMELNRRMMKAWGLDLQAFTGYTFLTNLWDVGAKLLLPVVAVLALARGGEAVTPSLRAASWAAGLAFVGVTGLAILLLASPRGVTLLAGGVERAVRAILRLVGRDRELRLAQALLDLRRECAQLVANGWIRMSAGIVGYVALQYLLLWWCLHLTGGGISWTDVLAGFAIERLLTILPITPGGVGVADLGLVGVLLALGGDPVAVTAAAVLYRAFVFAVEIPVGGGALGIWLLTRRRAAQVRRLAPAQVHRIAHVSDVFLPALGGIETHVDDLVRHQRARGLDAHVLTPAAGTGPDPEWVRRMPASEARRTVVEYDAVHVHLSMLSPYGIRLARSAMSAGVPTLITVHSMWTGAGAILRLAALATLRRWPVVWTAVSNAAAESFRRALGAIEVAVLPNAIDVADWRIATATATATAPGDPVTLISTMRLSSRKRPMQLLRAFRQVRRMAPHQDVRLVIVGDGRLRGRVERSVRRHGLSECVRVTGRLERHDVLAELSAASVYVAPAPKESFGIAVLEARCAGLPVVAFRRSGVSEFIRDRVDGILVDHEAELAVAVAELVVDDALRRRIADHNRSNAPVADWTDVLDQTLELYRLAVDRAVVPAGLDEPVLAGSA